MVNDIKKLFKNMDLSRGPHMWKGSTKESVMYLHDKTNVLEVAIDCMPINHLLTTIEEQELTKFMLHAVSKEQATNVARGRAVLITKLKGLNNG